MSNIKTFFLLILLVFGYSGFAQANKMDTTYFQRKNYLTAFTLKDNKPNLDGIKFNTSDQKISVYNQTTGLNDNYVIYNNKTNYVNSTIDFRNNMRGAKIDSFNPYGTKDIGLSIVTSVFSLLFN